MALSKATKAWLDTVADGSDHEALCACEVFAAFETGDGRVSAECRAWLVRMTRQTRYPLVRIRALDVMTELENLRSKVS